MKKIYLDHAATTPVDPEVLKAMQPFFADTFGNPSSLHSFGQDASRAVEQARAKVADFLACQPEEVIFTSGATESDNLALKGIIQAAKDVEQPHIITSSIEHPAVLETCKALEKNHQVDVSYLKPPANGILRLEDVKNEIKDNTILISIMYVNNEIGTIQPLKEIGEILKKINQNREHKIYFHTDAVQAVNYLPIKVDELGIDLASISAHKIYGPKGVGVLYVRQGTKIKNIQHGGHHEAGLRPGTINAPLIVGLGKAVELIPSRDNEKIKKLRDYLWQQIQAKIDNIKLNGAESQRVANSLNVSFIGVEGEAMLMNLDMDGGVAVSTGSACSSGSLEPSHVLMSIGLTHEQAHGSLRLTLGKDNTQQELDYFVTKLIESVSKYRKMAPDY